MPLTSEGLLAPETYCKATPDVIELMTDGCGTAMSRFDFVPDSIYGLDISSACRIHDWQYSEGKTIWDKDEADRVFMNNLLRLISMRSANTFMRWLRNGRALKYYQAVQAFGGPAYWQGKN